MGKELDVLKKRVLDISKKYGLTHIGSSLSALGILNKIYSIKKNDEPFILSSGHAGIALYVVLEKYFPYLNAEAMYQQHGVHATMCPSCKIYCSTGSLGHGINVAVGMALADRSRNAYCLLSDGECMEGSVYEGLRIAKKYNLKNLKLYVNANGYGGMEAIDPLRLHIKLDAFGFPIEFIRTNMDPLKDLAAHYERII